MIKWLLYFLVFILITLIIGYLIREKCNNRVYPIVMEYAPTAINILDLGCGTCCTTKKLQKQGKKITALDIVDKGICMKPQLFNGKDIPFNKKHFDLGICSFVLHHTRTQKELLFELKRTCKKIIILEDTPETEKEWNYIRNHAESDWGKCIECFNNATDWERLLNLVGLKVIEKKTINKWYCPFSDKPFFYPVTCTAFICE
uniref:Methyltransferase type 11 domain-containing protein n=1 Tax=viral metagenome TaxID=1070528 RepID=A0A6C0CTF5_9ZZZZ